MTAWLAARFAGLWAKLAVVGAVILAVLVAALRLVAIGKSQEKAAELAKEAGAAAAQRKLENEVAALPANELDARASKWVRDDPKR